MCLMKYFCSWKSGADANLESVIGGGGASFCVFYFLGGNYYKCKFNANYLIY